MSSRFLLRDSRRGTSQLSRIEVETENSTYKSKFSSQTLRERSRVFSNVLSVLSPGGVLPYIRYIGMCRPKGYGF